MSAVSFMLFLVSIGAAGAGGDRIEVPSVLLRLSDEAEAAAAEAGLLGELNVAEGAVVQENDVLARLEDREAKLAVQRADLELTIAKKDAQDDTGVRLAQKALQVAKTEYNRAANLISRYREGVSRSEVDRLRFVMQKTEVEVEQAQHRQEMAKMMLELKENDQQTAQLTLERRHIKAPFSGMVVELKRRRGEWVEPGEPVLRLVRIDTLRAEGFIDVGDVPGDLTNRPVTLTVELAGGGKTQFRGKVKFVSPELDPVNSQIRFWAEIQNTDGRLRPGLKGSLVIEP